MWILKTKKSYIFIFQMQLAVEEKCEFVPFQLPEKVLINGSKIVGITFHRNEEMEDGSWVADTEQITKLKCDFIISAFGSGLYDEEGILFFKVYYIFSSSLGWFGGE